MYAMPKHQSRFNQIPKHTLVFYSNDGGKFVTTTITQTLKYIWLWKILGNMKEYKEFIGLEHLIRSPLNP